MSTLHVTGGLPAWLATVARIAEPYRTERVAYACLVAMAWLCHQHPESTPDALSALPWLLGAVAGRAAVVKVGEAIGQRGASTAARRAIPADTDPPTDPGATS